MRLVSTTMVVRHDPVRGMSTELERTRVAMPPMAGMVLYTPMAKRRSRLSANHRPTAFGAPAEMRGPPTPNRAIANQSDPSPPADARRNPLAATTRDPSTMPRRTPRRSSSRPPAGALTM